MNIEPAVADRQCREKTSNVEGKMEDLNRQGAKVAKGRGEELSGVVGQRQMARF